VKLKHLRPMALSFVAVFATAPAALALDANDFGSKLLAAYSSSMSGSDKLTLGTGTVNGNDITFDGASMTTTSSTTPITMSTKLTFSNVVEAADGSYTADALSVPDVDYSANGGEVTVKNIALKHIYVDGSATPSAVDSGRLFGEIDIGPISYSMGGAPMVTLDAISIVNSFKPSQSDPQLTEVDSAGSATGLKIDLSQVKDADSAAQISALGLQMLTGKVGEALSWSLPDGHLAASEMSVGFDNVGKLNIGFDVTGYTPEFAKTLSAAGSAMGGADASGGASTAALMAAAQKLFVNGVTVRFDDASITGKLLDYFAKQSGASRADFITGIVGAMAQMGSAAPPALTKLLQAAMQAYLTDPHSIEIKIAPAAPLGVMDFMAAAMQPDQFVKQVGLKVLVNDKEVTVPDSGDTGAATAPGSDDSTATGSDDSSSDNSDSSN
jgi:hypothetical protein